MTKKINQNKLLRYQSLPLNKILVGDCIEMMRTLPAESIDLIFADPPYNLQLNQDLQRPDHSYVNGVDAKWDQFANFKAYDKFSQAWLSAARRLLKPNGAIWVIGMYHNIFRLGTLMQNLNFWILNDVIWRKTNPMPNFRGVRLTNAHETMIWAGKSKKARPTVNYDVLKAMNEGLQMRSDWVLPICSGGERLKDATGKKLHPTQKPEGLLYRVILASSHVDHVILDPFFGTGTTGAVAKYLHRHYIGIESDADYCQAANARINTIVPCVPTALQVSVSNRHKQRVPFAHVIECGMLRPGDWLFSQNCCYRAQIRIDGTLVAGEYSGSIHQVGAALESSASCNGWTYWRFKKHGKTISIDKLRQKIRQQMNL